MPFFFFANAIKIIVCERQRRFGIKSEKQKKPKRPLKHSKEPRLECAKSREYGRKEPIKKQDNSGTRTHKATITL